MTDPDAPDPRARARSRSGAAVRIALRLVVLVALVWAVHLLLVWANAQAQSGHIGMRRGVLVGLLLVYALLVAVPFVPGVEIGLTLMAIEGPWIAPWVYGATVAGLVLAYLAGEAMPLEPLRRALADLRLNRAAALLDRVHPLDKAQRLAVLQARAPRWARPLVSRFRYGLIALLINLPGSAVLGGGGGILFVAGFSRLFLRLPMVATILLAVAPVPFLVWALGLELSALWR